MSARRHISMQTKIRVALSAHGCMYCGDKDGPLEFDHFTPVSRGGGNEIENIVLACRPCNRRKGSEMPSDFLRREADECLRKATAIRTYADSLLSRGGGQ